MKRPTLIEHAAKRERQPRERHGSVRINLGRVRLVAEPVLEVKPWS